MPVAPGNRMYTAFPVRLMYVFPPFARERWKILMKWFPEVGFIDKDKLEFN